MVKRNINIRLFTKQDIQQIQSVAHESWRYAYDGLIPLRIQDDFLCSAYSEKALMTEQSPTVLMVAECEGDIIGFIHFSFMNIRREIELGALYILPAFHRNGVGTKLLKALHEYFNDIDKIIVSAVSQNVSAIDFYESQGFRKVEKIDAAINQFYIPTVIMEWRKESPRI